MIDSKQTSNSTDEALIEHFRQHTTGEPPATLDAFILAAARREAPTPTPSLWKRWLQACQRPRWQMAFATVAGVALMIGLVVRSPVPQEPAPLEYSANRQELAVDAAPPTAMRTPAPMARMAPQAEMAEAPASPVQSLADKPEVNMSKSTAVALLSLEQSLLEILRLRQAGETKAADEKLLALHKRFPKEDLPARLEALQKR